MIPEFITKIDWELLKEQKIDIVYITDDIKESIRNVSEGDIRTVIYNKWIDSLNGIIELIDALQDYAVDELEMGEDIIFY